MRVLFSLILLIAISCRPNQSLSPATEEDGLREAASLTIAAERALSSGDSLLLATCKSRIGRIYLDYSLVEQAEECFSTSIKGFEAFDETVSACQDRLLLAEIMIDSRRFPEAELLLRQNLLAAETANDEILKDQTRAVLSTQRVAEGLYRDAVTILDSIEERGHYQPNSNQLARFAFAYARLGNDKRADELIKRARDISATRKERLHIMKTEADILECQGRYQEAYSLLVSVDQLKDVLLTKELGEAVLSSQLDAFRDEANEERRHVREWKFKALGMALVLLILLVLAYTIYKKRIAEKELNLLREHEINQNLAKTIRDLQYSSIEISNFRALNSMCELLYSNTANLFIHQLNLQIDEYRKDGPAQNKLEAILDEKTDGIISAFKSDFKPSVINAKSKRDHRNEVRLFTYLAAGFSDAAICVLLGLNNLSSCYSRKSRLRDKILKSDFSHRDNYLSLMDSKKNLS